MRDEAYYAALANPDHLADHDGGIYTAADAWCRDPAAAKARYGPIASWDTSGITDMRRLFLSKRDFNEDISRWNVSNVVDMRNTFNSATSFNGDLSNWDVGQVMYMAGTFCYATSFDRQLGGAWATSTAEKHCMFFSSPGTIAGKTKTADGTIE
jgi:surface protein